MSFPAFLCPAIREDHGTAIHPNLPSHHRRTSGALVWCKRSCHRHTHRSEGIEDHKMHRRPCRASHLSCRHDQRGCRTHCTNQSDG